MSICRSKHTKYQPVEWKCPNCGATADEGFIIDYPAEDADDNCDLLHKGDTVACERCDSTWTGTTLSNKIKRVENAQPCPHCHGKGWIKKE